MGWLLCTANPLGQKLLVDKALAGCSWSAKSATLYFPITIAWVQTIAIEKGVAKIIKHLLYLDLNYYTAILRQYTGLL